MKQLDIDMSPPALEWPLRWPWPTTHMAFDYDNALGRYGYF